jgi:hypothetical protein
MAHSTQAATVLGLGAPVGVEPAGAPVLAFPA